MKIMKKIVYIIILVIASLVMYSTIVKAATTVTVTADTLNLREKASTSSNIIATLSKGVKCDFIEESGDWYKVQYKTYTGYVSKEYVKKNEDVTKNNANENDNTGDTNNDNQKDTDTNVGNENTLTTGKVSSKTDVKIVPLIYSSKIDELAKNTNVTIYTEINGWSYIQTDTITGWIRSDIITSKKTISISSSDEGTGNAQVDNSSSNSNDNTTGNDTQVGENSSDTTNAADNQTTTYTEKTMYINESSVNVRKEPSTSSEIVMVLALNTKLTVIGEEGDWYKVKTSEGNAYVSKKLLSSKQTTTSRGGSITEHTSTTTTNNVDKTTSVASTATATLLTTTTVAQSNAKSSSTQTSSSTTKGQEVVEYAKQFLGVPYVYGGASKSGFDCSGFTMYVYKKFGISMRHGAQAQAKLGTAVKVDKKSATSLKQNLQPGDLVFFLDYETMDEIGHCGIYIGDGKFIHASSGSGYCVKINSLLPGEYYNTRYCAARRVL